MIHEAQIQGLAHSIGDRFGAKQVTLFGSYAYGTPDEDSDVDLLVVLPFSGSHIAKAVEIVRAVNPPFSVDLIVWRPEELTLRLAQGDFFYVR